jgi:sortase A
MRPGAPFGTMTATGGKPCKGARLAAAALCGALAAWQIGAGLWIPAKAWLAQALIAEAWQEALDSGRRVPPWPWADTAPVARLTVPSLGVDQVVLAHATGRSLAFGPAHLDGSAAPGAPGLSVLSGHRDTSFAFLADLAVGTALRLQRTDGVWLDFRVAATRVLDERVDGLPRLVTGRPSLALVTCYPLDAIVPGGPLRYVVYAEAMAAGPQPH